MRPIKFRAFEKDGFLLGEFGLDDIADGYFMGFLLKDLVVVQFTGLLDSKGIDMWEGDMVNHPQAKFATEVFYDVNCGAYQPFSFSGKPAHEFTIEGNKFKNPELLK